MPQVINYAGGALIGSLLLVGLLAWFEKPIPDALGALPGLALTGILALLAKR